MKKIFTSFFLLLSVSISCETNDFMKQNKGAIIFSFDDAWINEWYNSRFLFEKYNIKVTFCINRPQLLNTDQKINY